MVELTVQAVDGVKKSGWREGRRVSIDPAIEAWRNIDRLPSIEVQDVMREFFSLSLIHPHHWAKDATDFTEINPFRAAANAHAPVLVDEYEVGAGQLLTPFGIMGCGVLLFIGEDGSVYGGNSPYLGCYGNSFQDFLNLLYSDRRPIVLLS